MRKKVIFLLTLLTGFVFFLSCSKEKDLNLNNDSSIAPESRLKAGAGGIKGVNWADARDNYQSGWVLPSGINAGDSYSTIKSHAQTICFEFINKLGANTVRIPINPPTVSQWWNNYKGVIDGALAQGMKVIIACWTESGSIGYVTDWNAFKSMWTTVVNAYAGNSSVYFEILNEPYSYSKNDLLNMYSAWLGDHSNAPRGRVLCGGTGYSDNVNNIGGDSRISGCLYSQHIYPWWGSGNLSYWYNNLLGRIGSSNYSKTVVTEFGCVQNSGLNFYGTSSSDNNVCFFQGVANSCRDKGISCCYWPGLRDGDSFSMTTRNSNYKLNIVNSSGVNELKWAYH